MVQLTACRAANCRPLVCGFSTLAAFLRLYLRTTVVAVFLIFRSTVVVVVVVVVFLLFRATVVVVFRATIA